TFQENSTFSHTSTPEPNNRLSVTQVLVSNTRVHTVTLQEGFLTGGSVTLNYSDHYLNENAPTDVLNPSSATSLGLSFQHNLLRGFGVAVNARTINVAKINLGMTDLNFKTQVVGTVANVLNAYYTLAADVEDTRAKRQASDVARRFLEITRRQVEVGSLAPLDAMTAESQYAASEKDAILSETSQQQDELRLKLLLSRNGLSDPLLASARIVPVDRIVIPEEERIEPMPELVKRAITNRSDLAAEKESIRATEVSNLGTRNGVLPLAVAIGGTSQSGLSGKPVPAIGEPPADPYFIGGIDTALGQTFRRNFPTQRIGIFLQAPLYNRQAQADEAIDQIELRQQQLQTAKDYNQLQVDLQNAVVALQQARARYDAAMRNRNLQQQLLDAEQRKFNLETSTPYNVIQQQRDLVNAQSSVLAAQVAYSQARISLDQTLGTTLDSNGISLGEVKAGKISRRSTPVSPAP
ncbi:MAG: TolC family protein, partial [Acidobacteriaceae bacterium]|nr:TolC family protein [Acidobacteriaceae bacterium]